MDLNVKAVKVQQDYAVSLREKGVDLNVETTEAKIFAGASPFVRREWI